MSEPLLRAVVSPHAERMDGDRCVEANLAGVVPYQLLDGLGVMFPGVTNCLATCPTPCGQI